MTKLDHNERWSGRRVDVQDSDSIVSGRSHYVKQSKKEMNQEAALIRRLAKGKNGNP